jgi:hypothetical protein
MKKILFVLLMSVGLAMGNDAPNFLTPIADVTTYANTAVFLRVAAADYDGPQEVTYSITSGPSNAVISKLSYSQGLLTWYPTWIGTNRFTLKATDGKDTDTQSFRVIVQPWGATNVFRVPTVGRGLYISPVPEGNWLVQISSDGRNWADYSRVVGGTSFGAGYNPYSFRIYRFIRQ